jgi:hypothetical protein
MSELRDIITGYLSTIEFVPAEYDPTKMQPVADKVLEIAGDWQPEDGMHWAPDENGESGMMNL